MKIVNSIRATLGMNADWAGNCQTWQEAMSRFTAKIEEAGIITVFNGIVGNNTHRPILVDECRGFVLVDEMAPLIFINNADAKAAQMFTIAHELAHIWTGFSAGFDFRRMQPADNPNEILCNKIAAELLVPAKSLKHIMENSSDINHIAHHFKVSEIVAARRLLDIGMITKKQFFEFYNDYSTREFSKKNAQKSGGDFYATTRKRLGMAFAGYISNAVNTGKLLYRDAYRLTNLHGKTFHTFFADHLK